MEKKKKAPHHTNTPKKVLLIGTSQNGKSTLANFLYYGRKYQDVDDPFFAMGNGLASCTTEIKSARFSYTYNKVRMDDAPVTATGEAYEREYYSRIESEEHQIEVTDTPGLGDSQGDDTEIVLSLFDYLKNLKDADEISGLLLVIKFRNMLDDRYIRNMLYYKKLFKEAFEINSTIVITNCIGTEEWLQKGRGENKNKNTIDTTIKAFREIFDKDMDFVYLDADPDSEEGEQVAIRMRKIILDKCCSVAGTKLRSVLFPKPMPWVDADRVEISGLESRVKGIEQGISVAQERVRDLFDRKLKLERDNVEFGSNLDHWYKTLADYDTSSKVWVQSFSCSDTWHFFRNAEDSFDIVTDLPITEYTWSGSGRVHISRKEERRLSGHVWAPPFYYFHMSFNVFTDSRHYHSTKIKSLKGSIEETQQRKAKNEKEIRELDGKMEGEKSEVAKLSHELKVITERLLLIKKEELTFTEFKLRLLEFQKAPIDKSAFISELKGKMNHG